MNGIQKSGEQKVMHYESTTRKNCFLFNFYLITSTLTILLFLYGFFPINYNEEAIATSSDIPSSIESINIKKDELYKPEIQKVVLVVIDALRWDFVNEQDMPITNKLLKKSNGCLYKTKVHPPTVTLPRVKAIATGTVPNFIDVVLNLGAPKIKGDSILQQVKNAGHNIIFFGDLTWPKLFPNMFKRFMKTDTFMMSEYKEADANVTTHLMGEMSNRDWSLMIIHYSGVDHIGHMEGPNSPLIKEKLLEMDDAIERIQRHIETMNERENTPALLLVTGDHGMMESGSHGGSTLEETLVPLLTFGRPCTYKNSYDDLIAQIDIAPTLAVLFGVPIPYSSSGAVILNLLSNVTVPRRLFALHYNAKHLFRHYSKNNADYRDSDAYGKYQLALQLHSRWLMNKNSSTDEIISTYESSILEMQMYLTNNLFRYNHFVISMALTAMISILLLNVLTKKSYCLNPKTGQSWRWFKFIFVAFFTFANCLILIIALLPETETDWLFQFYNVHTTLPALFFTTVLLINSFLLSNLTLEPALKRMKLFFKENSITSLHVLLPLATIAHALNLGSSSYVEEEHLVWYYYGSSLLAYITYEAIRRNVELSSMSLPVSWLMGMFAHRIFRLWNSTGFQNGNAYDVADWLYDSSAKTAMTYTVIIGLGLLLLLDFYHEENEALWHTLALNTFMAVLIFLRHGADKSVARPIWLPDWRGITEVRIFWLLMLIYTIISLTRLIISVRRNDGSSLRLFLFLTLKKWIIVSALLHRPQNVILLPVQAAFGSMIAKYTRKENKRGLKIFLYIWSSNVFFFYQGNSNSLSTVDLKAGYVGLETYWPSITGAFLLINTYSAPIMGFLMFLLDQAYLHPLLTPKITILLCQKYAVWRLVPTVVYMIVMTIHRYHISVWTVFSPKILYEATHTIILFAVIFILELCFTVQGLFSQSK